MILCKDCVWYEFNYVAKYATCLRPDRKGECVVTRHDTCDQPVRYPPSIKEMRAVIGELK